MGEDRIYLHGTHEFGDTKYRKVTYSAIATTRFGEYFRRRNKEVKLAASTPFSLSGKRLVEGSETVRLADNTASFKPYDPQNKSGDYVMDYAAGTIRRTSSSSEKASGIPENSELEVTFIEEPITRRTENPFTKDVLSSARPAAPKLLYIVPTFSWRSAVGIDDSRVRRSTRTGGGVRIYMESWYSPATRLLGVLWRGRQHPLSRDAAHEKIKPFVTHWGSTRSSSGPSTPADAGGVYALEGRAPGFRIVAGRSAGCLKVDVPARSI